MAGLEMTRCCATSPEIEFDAISRPEILLQWWGPEGLAIEPDNLDTHLSA